MEKAFKTYRHNQLHQVAAAQHLQYKADGGVALVRTTEAHSIQMSAEKVTDAGCDGYKGTIVEDDCNHAFSILTNGCDTNTLTGKRDGFAYHKCFFWSINSPGRNPGPSDGKYRIHFHQWMDEWFGKGYKIFHKVSMLYFSEQKVDTDHCLVGRCTTTTTAATCALRV